MPYTNTPEYSSTYMPDFAAQRFTKKKKSTDRSYDMMDSTKKKLSMIKEGSKVVVLRNTVHARHPTLQREVETGEQVTVMSVGKQRVNRDEYSVWCVVFGSVDECLSFIPVCDVDPIVECMCDIFTVDSVGCQCGIVVND